ncbi:hypothetical protein [Micromonospora sp. NPDC126480]|uniref:hypothetical protein n=1 Tax=Micromonospora sp. NPDC126480 TaxID=3155312 RepID=UPI003321730F
MTDPTAPVPPDQPATPPTSVDPDEAATLALAPTSGKRNGNVLLAVAATALLFIGVGGAAALLSGDSEADGKAVAKQSELAAAREECSPGDTRYAELGDEGRTLTLHGAGEEDAGLSYSVLLCYWRALDVPDAIVSEIGATRALDGRQTGEWDKMRASWSYHPDHGLQMVLTIDD